MGITREMLSYALKMLPEWEYRRVQMEKQAVIKPGITPDLDEDKEKQAADLSEKEKIKRLEDQDEQRRMLGAIYHDVGRKIPPFAG